MLKYLHLREAHTIDGFMVCSFHLKFELFTVAVLVTSFVPVS